jgi:hypothetical protein
MIACRVRKIPGNPGLKGFVSCENTEASAQSEKHEIKICKVQHRGERKKVPGSQ